MKTLLLLSCILSELIFNFHFATAQDKMNSNSISGSCNPSYCIYYLSNGISQSTVVAKDLETEIFDGNALLNAYALYMQDLHISIKANESTTDIKEIKIEAFSKLPDGTLVGYGIVDQKYVPPVNQNQILDLDYQYPTGLCIPSPVILRLKIGFNCSVYATSTVQSIFISN